MVTVVLNKGITFGKLQTKRREVCKSHSESTANYHTINDQSMFMIVQDQHTATYGRERREREQEGAQLIPQV